MRQSNKNVKLFSFILFSIFLLLVYDLFNEVEKRGDVTSARNLPRFYRILLLIITIVFYYSKASIRSIKFNKYLIVIYLMLIINIVLSAILGMNSLISISKILYILFTYLFFFKYFSFYSNEKVIKYFNIYVISSVILISFYIILNRIFISGELGAKTYGDNNSYVLLSFLPLLYFIKNIKTRRILMILLIIGIFLGLKRGAMLGLFLCLLGGFILEKRVQKRKNTLTSLKKNFIVIISGLFLFYVYYKFESIFIERFQDFTEKGESFGSGRGNIYSLIFDDWFQSNDYKTYILGKGYNSVQILTNRELGYPLMAHSDLLNFIHSYGLLGISLVLMFIFHQFKIIRKLYIVKNKLVIPYFMILVIFTLKSIYSGNFETPNFVYLLIGYAMLNFHLNIKEQ